MLRFRSIKEIRANVIEAHVSGQPVVRVVPGGKKGKTVENVMSADEVKGFLFALSMVADDTEATLSEDLMPEEEDEKPAKKSSSKKAKGKKATKAKKSSDDDDDDEE